jgi:hypothetical protein
MKKTKIEMQPMHSYLFLDIGQVGLFSVSNKRATIDERLQIYFQERIVQHNCEGMRAGLGDRDRVFDVVEEQVERTPRSEKRESRSTRNTSQILRERSV